MNKKAIVVHSGGMDSSICLAIAAKEYGPENILSLSFTYGQRHSEEIDRAKEIATFLKIDHTVVDINCLSEITQNALTNHQMNISHEEGSSPNTLVVGRNGLMARIAAIHANHLGAHFIYMGIIEVESANSGYRDCSRSYMDKMQEILRIDLDDSTFEIKTPIVNMTKVQTMQKADELNILELLLEKTITCYEGVEKFGCNKCPACKLRNEGIKQYLKMKPSIKFSYRNKYND